MENKQPKEMPYDPIEIWVVNHDIDALRNTEMLIMVDACSSEKTISEHARDFTKYISESHHNSIVSELKEEIERLKKTIER